jgi:1,4-dihydroxy-2-naphthoate octaprenyltransferase
MIIYFLGGGIAHFLGADFYPLDFWLGIFWIISIHIAGYLLILNFSLPLSGLKKEEIKILLSHKKISILQLSMLFFSVSGVFIAILLKNNELTISIGTLFVLTVLGLLVLAIPPFSMAKKGYQEIALAIFQGCLIPAFGFFLLSNNFHRLLSLIVFPMTLLALAYYIALNFVTYAHDERISRKSFVRKLTWQRAVLAHHVLLFSAYLFFFLGYGRGLPIEILRILLLTLPMAGFQIFWLQRIVRGGRPLWPFFNVLAASVYCLSAYLITLSLWTQ